MQIASVTTAKKIADFSLLKNSKQKITISYLKDLDNKYLTDNAPRIYLIVSNGEIKKIGGSAQQGGIKGTMNFYVNALSGSPGVPRFVIHHLIAEELTENKKVELFMITSPPVKAKINGLFGSHVLMVSSFKEMENICKTDYFNLEKKYPDWNFQENRQPYPNNLAKLHNKFHNDRLSN
jgi:hypothetical protein